MWKEHVTQAKLKEMPILMSALALARSKRLLKFDSDAGNRQIGYKVIQERPNGAEEPLRFSSRALKAAE